MADQGDEMNGADHAERCGPANGLTREKDIGRRGFLKGALIGGAAAAAAPHLTESAQVQERGRDGEQEGAPSPAAAGYMFLNLDEAAFVEALVDHMVPADELTPKGTDIGINIYIDRALAGGWGKGDRLYMQGPWKPRRAEPGLSIAAHAGAALSRRHRGDQRALPQDLRQDLRPARRAAARGGAARTCPAARSPSTAGCRRACSGPRSIRP